MKTNTRLITIGILATIIFVVLCLTAQAQTPVTGWGTESDQSAGATLVETPSIGAFTIPGNVTGNYEIRANLTTPVSLVNAGDYITFSGVFIFPSNSIGNQAFRIAILDTNGNNNCGILSGGVWTRPTGGNPTNWLGYIVDLGTGGSPVVAGRTGGVTKDWDSTSGDFYNMLTVGSLTNGPNAVPGTYYVSMTVQKVSGNFLNIYYSMTNASGSYSNMIGQSYCYDDGSQQAGKVAPSTTTFNAVGFFQNGSVGGGIGPFSYTNITVSSGNNPVTGWTNVMVDTFKPAGIGPNSYSGGKIINVWTNWFGAAWVTNTWNSTADADGNAGSGSLQILADWTQGNQFFVYDQLGGISPPAPVPGLNMADLSCDVQFDPSSSLTTNNGVGLFGHLQIGTINNGSFITFSNNVTGYDIASTNAGWVHINIPLNATLNTYQTAISNIVFKIDGNWYSPNLTAGTTTLRVDNVRFIENNGLVGVALSNPPPVIALSQATPGMRIFAKATSSFARDEVGTANQGVSWYNGPFPVSYSFTLANVPPLSVAPQIQIFMIPVNSLPYAPYGNTFADFDATNCFGLIINTSASNYVATVSYKINAPSTSIPVPANNLVTNYGSSTFTNQASGNGTWTLTFTDNTHGTLTGPGNTPVNFTMPAGDAAQFANPLVAYFGIQVNSANSQGQHVDYTNIRISNGAGDIINDNFASGLGNWTAVGSDSGGIWDVTPDSGYWINWTFPAVGFDVEVGTAITAGGTWINPAFYSGYEPGPLTETVMANKAIWTLISTNNLPPGKTGFFRVSNSPNY